MKKDLKKNEKEKETKELMGLIVDIKGCARCGEDHDEHMIKQFRNPSVALKDGVEIVHNFWSFCPTSNEPNFFYIVVEVQEHGGTVVEEGAEKPNE